MPAPIHFVVVVGFWGPHPVVHEFDAWRSSKKGRPAAPYTICGKRLNQEKKHLGWTYLPERLLNPGLARCSKCVGEETP